MGNAAGQLAQHVEALRRLQLRLHGHCGRARLPRATVRTVEGRRQRQGREQGDGEHDRPVGEVAGARARLHDLVDAEDFGGRIRRVPHDHGSQRAVGGHGVDLGAEALGGPLVALTGADAEAEGRTPYGMRAKAAAAHGLPDDCASARSPADKKTTGTSPVQMACTSAGPSA